MQTKSDELVLKNKSLHNKNKGVLLSCRVPIGGGLKWSNPTLLFAELETRVEQLRASEVGTSSTGRRRPVRYLNMTISSWLMSAISTWSFELCWIMTSSTAINLRRS
jgi:hypothetical protein